MHRRLALVLLLFFLSQLEKAYWVFEAGRFDESEREQDFVKYKNMLDQRVQSN
jgi:hypothetical protein